MTKTLTQLTAEMSYQSLVALRPDKYLPCGCVLCTCENENQCQGCGATYCHGHAHHPVTYRFEDAVGPLADHLRSESAHYTDCTAGPLMRAAAAEIDRLKALIARAKSIFDDIARGDG